MGNGSGTAPVGFSAGGLSLLIQYRGGAFGRMAQVSMGSGHATAEIVGAEGFGNPELSPDGHWLAYQQGGSGAGPQVYVRPFPEVGEGRWQVSVTGGVQPVWAKNGRELFYIQESEDGDSGRLVAVPIEFRPRFSAGAPVALFEKAILA